MKPGEIISYVKEDEFSNQALHILTQCKTKLFNMI